MAVMKILQKMLLWQGQFVKGNKTLQEYTDVMDNANGRSQTESILLEHQVFMPMKQILKLNILQYQGGTTLYNRDKQVAIEIDPIKLRKSVLEFKVSDGLIPSSKLISEENFSVALQSIASSPAIGNGFNIAPMFSYLMKTKGADLTPFEKSPEQLAYEQAMGSWQQLAMLGIEKGIDPKELPPQPKPIDFNYDPRNNDPSSSNEEKGEPESQTPTPGPQ